MSAIGPRRVTAADRAAALGVTAPRPIELTDAPATGLTRLHGHADQPAPTPWHPLHLLHRPAATRPGRRLLGYAYTLRYVPQREDLLDQLQAGLNAQKRAVESIGSDEVLVIEAREQDGAGTIGDILAMRLPTRRGRHRHRRLCPPAPRWPAWSCPSTPARPHGHARPPAPAARHQHSHRMCGGAGHARRSRGGRRRRSDGAARGAGRGGGPGRRLQEEQEAFAPERVTAGESIVGLYPLADSRRADFETWRSQHRS